MWVPGGFTIGKQIQAGQSGQIEVSVDTSGLTGAIDKSVTIITNDPRRPSASLSVRAEVQPEISVSSPSIYFEKVPEGKEVTREVIIAVAAERSIRILSAESTDPSVIVKLEPVPDSEGKKVKLIAAQKGDGKIGYRSGTIIVKTPAILLRSYRSTSSSGTSIANSVALISASSGNAPGKAAGPPNK